MELGLKLGDWIIRLVYNEKWEVNGNMLVYFKVGTTKCATHLKLPSLLCVHLQNHFYTYVEEILLEPNFIL